MTDMAGNFEELKCWQFCSDLKLYLKEEVLPKLPSDEKFELYSQIRRASRSATANIAEGWGRYHYKDQIKFLINARGSVSEVLDHIVEANSWNYIDIEVVETVREKVNSCLQLINGYIRYIRKNDNNKNKP